MHIAGGSENAPSPISSSSSCSLQQLNNLHCFSQEVQDGILHFQILKLNKQLYVWVGCNSAKLGQLYASMPTPFERTPSLATLIGGTADSVGAGIARRLALKTGWSIVLACNLPKNSPSLEVKVYFGMNEAVSNKKCSESVVVHSHNKAAQYGSVLGRSRKTAFAGAEDIRLCKISPLNNLTSRVLSFIGVDVFTFKFGALRFIGVDALTFQVWSSDHIAYRIPAYISGFFKRRGRVDHCFNGY